MGPNGGGRHVDNSAAVLRTPRPPYARAPGQVLDLLCESSKRPPKQKDPSEPMMSCIPLYWALEPECDILCLCLCGLLGSYIFRRLKLG